MPRKLRTGQLVALASLTLFLLGCAPTAREIASEMSRIPVGISRAQFREELTKAYPERVPRTWHTETPLVVTHGYLEFIKKFIEDFKQRNNFVMVHPPDLFATPPVFFEPIGLAAESARGNGGIDLYYDSQMNYIGFLADSTEKVKSE